MNIFYEKVTKYYKNQKYHKDGSLFVDTEFPPCDFSLNKDKSISMCFKPSEIVWKRPDEIFNGKFSLFGKSIKIDDTNKNDIGNSYFLSSLSALNSIPNIINQLFVTKNVNPLGAYEIILFIDGEYQIVIIDDYLPVSKEKPHKLIFSNSKRNEIWIMLLEKAWAKVNGSYAEIMVRTPKEVLKALTGFSTERLLHKEIPENDLFNRILESLKFLCVLYSTTNDENNNDKGLLKNYVYSLISAFELNDKKEKVKLIKLRSCSGKWSDAIVSSKKNIPRELQIENDMYRCDEGIFHISIKDFIKYFYCTDICYVQNKCIRKYYDITQFIDLPCIFYLYLVKDGLVSISILKKNWRFNQNMRGKIYPCSLILLSVATKEVCGSFDNEDDINITKFLQKGLYYIYTYYDKEHSNAPKLERYRIQVNSKNEYKLFFCYYDINFTFLKYIIIDLVKENNKKKISRNLSSIFSSSDFYNSGFSYTVIINSSKIKSELWSNNTNHLINIFLLNPSETGELKILVYPKTSRCVLGMKSIKHDNNWFDLTFTKTVVENVNEISKEYLIYDDSNVEMSVYKIKGFQL